MPRRRVTIAALMLVVLFVGMAIALVQRETEARRLRSELYWVRVGLERELAVQALLRDEIQKARDEAASLRSH